MSSEVNASVPSGSVPRALLSRPVRPDSWKELQFSPSQRNLRFLQNSHYVATSDLTNELSLRVPGFIEVQECVCTHMY